MSHRQRFSDRLRRSCAVRSSPAGILAGLVVLVAASPRPVLGEPPTAGDPLQVLDLGREDAPATPAEQYRALLGEYNAGSADFRKATTDEERNAAVELLEKFAVRFLELAEKHPDDPITMEVLTQAVRAVNGADSLVQVAWEMNTAVFPARGKDDIGERLVALLRRDQLLRSAGLGPVCERMTYGVRKEFDPFLRLVLHANPHRDVQGLACLALARFLNSRLQKLDLVRDRPELARRYEGLFGKECFEELGRQGRAGAGEEVEAFFEKAARTYEDVKLPFGGTVGERAVSELFELRHLAIGRPAPEIEGEDQDGARFRLSDYRGRVVLLDFWQEY